MHKYIPSPANLQSNLEDISLPSFRSPTVWPKMADVGQNQHHITVLRLHVFRDILVVFHLFCFAFRHLQIAFITKEVVCPH